MKTLLLFILIPISLYSQISITPYFINFGEVKIGVQKDTIIEIESIDKNITLESFDFKFGSDSYSIGEALPIDIKAGQKKTISISYKPTDSVKSYTEYSFKIGSESISIGLLGGYKYQDTVIEATTITSPVKNEYYLYQDDIIINWDKIPNFDRYIVKFTTNNGSIWTILSDSVIGTSYTWKAPHNNSDKCAVRVEPYIEPEKKFLEYEWSKIFDKDLGGSPNKVFQTKDGGLLLLNIISGKDSSSDKKLYTDIQIIKTNMKGKEIWLSEFGGKEGIDLVNSVVEDNDGNFIFIGYTSSSDFGLELKGKEDLLLMKLDKNGNLIWKKNFGGSKSDFGIGIVKDKNEDYYLGGYSSSEDLDINSHIRAYDYWLLKIDKLGGVIWEKSYGREINEVLEDIDIDKEGNIILLGTSNSRDTISMSTKYGKYEYKEHIWLVKISPSGEELWDYQFARGYDTSPSFAILDNGDIVLVGYTVIFTTPGFTRSHWFLKLNSLGKLVTVKDYYFGYEDYLKKILVLPNGGIYYFSANINGSNNIKSRITKLSDSGEQLWYKEITNFSIVTGTMMSTFDNGLLLFGLIRLDKNNSSMILLKYSITEPVIPAYSGLFEIVSNNTNITVDSSEKTIFKISPNPASEQLNIDITTGVQGTMKLELVATDGRIIYSTSWTQSTKSKQMQINTINIPSGMYQVRLITPYDAITKSVIVVE